MTTGTDDVQLYDDFASNGEWSVTKLLHGIMNVNIFNTDNKTIGNIIFKTKYWDLRLIVIENVICTSSSPLSTSEDNLVTDHSPLEAKSSYSWTSSVPENGLGKMTEMGSTFINVNVNYNGTVTWTPFEAFQTRCAVDTTFFPFESLCRCNLH
jgi:hypothetical protein